MLAHDFDLRAGRVEVTVPDLITSTNYSIVCKCGFLRCKAWLLTGIAVFGDSGNWGETFTINDVID